MRASELHALALLADERHPLVLDAELLGQPLHHVRRLLHFLAEQQAADIAVEQERRIGLQVDPAHLPRGAEQAGFVGERIGAQLELDRAAEARIEVGLGLFQPIVVGLGLADGANGEANGAGARQDEFVQAVDLPPD